MKAKFFFVSFELSFFKKISGEREKEVKTINNERVTDLHILPSSANTNQQCLLVRDEGERARRMHFAHLEQSSHVVVDYCSWHYGLLAWRSAHPHAAEVVW